MADGLAGAMDEMTDMQRRAVEWSGGPLLVLAGPGSGKTRVLTCRIARLLLDTAVNKPPRVLALTFTNKAAHEMRTRLAALAPGIEDRAEVNTFHGFCAQVLRQHGAHLGLKPNFEIFSRTVDREALLADALRRRPERFGNSDRRLMPRIDALKARLVRPDQAAAHLADQTGLAPNRADRIALAYRLYEDELSRANALDFNSLLLGAFELLEYPALAGLYRTIYRYWLIDEFQDTNASQYALLRRMAGGDFRQLFAVADDDQTIYEWNGANVRRIGELVDDFGCEVIQLPDNFRCPPAIVEAANRLVVYNVRRDRSKTATKAAKRHSERSCPDIQDRVYPNDQEEATGIAAEIAALDLVERDETAVLARSRALLEAVGAALGNLNVPTAMLGRRDDFVSPQMRWLVASLRQINRPLDQRNMHALIETFAGFADCSVKVDDVVSSSETRGVTLLTAWLDALGQNSPSALPLVEGVAGLASGDLRLGEAVAKVIECFNRDDADRDLVEDLSAWRRIEREIRQARGSVPLDQFLQEMELRSKEPVPAQGAVSLGTVHGAKGLEFERVYLMGLAEEVFPSWQSVKNGNGAALEEERRSCFVGITRTKRHLVLSRARSYRGWRKQPSRFLREMGLLDPATPQMVRRRP